MSKANRTTETEVGLLSKLVTELYTRKAQRMLDCIEEGMDADLAIDTRAVQAIAKWVLDNGIYASPDANDEESPLAARLNQIKAKSGSRVLDFKKEAGERGQG